MMNVYNIGNQIIERFFPQFKGDICNIWKACPNRMLWEAISKNDATILLRQTALNLLSIPTDVYILPEFLPALYMGVTPAFKTACSTSLLGFDHSENEVLSIEPLYIVSCDFSWMLVFTTENNMDKGQLCAIIDKRS